MYQAFQLFCVFFLIGSFTLGSGLAMVPQIQKELVSRHHWLTEDEFVDILAVFQSAPGPIAVNLAVFSGLEIAGNGGRLFAVSHSYGFVVFFLQE